MTNNKDSVLETLGKTRESSKCMCVTVCFLFICTDKKKAPFLLLHCCYLYSLLSVISHLFAIFCLTTASYFHSGFYTIVSTHSLSDLFLIISYLTVSRNVWKPSILCDYHQHSENLSPIIYII